MAGSQKNKKKYFKKYYLWLANFASGFPLKAFIKIRWFSEIVKQIRSSYKGIIIIYGPDKDPGSSG